jgi:predicted transcriptional regulator
MPILKKKEKAPETTVLSVRLEAETADKLKAYAVYLDGTPNYVVGEALKYIFKRDPDFEAAYSKGALQSVVSAKGRGKASGA